MRGGHVRLNGRALAVGLGDAGAFGRRLAQVNLDAGGGPDVPASTVPVGWMLVMGDHRGDSFDGRFFGLVPARDIYGSVMAVYYRRGDGLSWKRP